MKLWPFKVLSSPGDKPMIEVIYKGDKPMKDEPNEVKFHTVLSFMPI